MDPFCGGVDLRCERFLVKMYVKMEELGPVGWRAPTNFVCRSANAIKNSSEFCSTRDGACLRQVTVIVLPAKIEQPHNFQKSFHVFFYFLQENEVKDTNHHGCRPRDTSRGKLDDRGIGGL